MRLGLNLGYWGGHEQVHDNLAVAQEADRLGYSVAWAAEAYGSDTPTVLAWVGALTSSIDLGAAVMQIPARTPAATAMTAATLDALSGGRFRLGLGVSGPQVSEGWHGVRFAAPLARTREYVEIVRMALRRDTVAFQGQHWTLPLPDGPGKALKLTVHPVRPQIPIYLAAVGPKNLELAGEIADGWLAIFYSPEAAADLHASIAAGAARAGRTGRQAGRTGIQEGIKSTGTKGDGLPEGFDIVPTVPVVIEDDLERAAGPLRANAALYVGGMGSREQNFYNALAVRMGFGEAAARVQDLYLARQHRDAAAAVPLEFIDQTSLIGSRARVRDRLARYADVGVTTLTVAPYASRLEQRLRTVRTMAELLDEAGLAD